AIEGFGRQVDWPSDMLVDAVGYDTEEKLRGPAKGDIHLMPSMRGGGGKFGSIILGAVMIGAALLLPGLGVALSSALSTSLIVSGSLMILQGVVGLFLKAP